MPAISSEVRQRLGDLPTPTLNRGHVTKAATEDEWPSRRFRSANDAPAAAARLCPVWRRS
jgi:hypothetical protein